MKDAGGSSESLAGQIVTELTGSAQSNGVISFCSITWVGSTRSGLHKVYKISHLFEANPSHDQNEHGYKISSWLHQIYIPKISLVILSGKEE
jgi:hypothetical protein